MFFWFPAKDFKKKFLKIWLNGPVNAIEILNGIKIVNWIM